MKEVIQLNQLTKSYQKLNAVDQITISLAENKIYGLLGRNGAGKSTLLQLITSQIFATSGEIKVFGESPFENRKVLSKICFIREGQLYPQNFTINDALKTAADFYPNWDKSYANRLVEHFQLPLDRRIKKLSKGMFSSVGIIIGLASRAPLTIFDEPYLGLDPVARNLFYNELMNDYGRYPRTIILTTHLIDEISHLIEHVIVIDQGKILIDQQVDEVRERGYTVIGSTKQIKLFLAGKTPVSQRPLGDLSLVTFTDTLTAEIRQEADQLHLNLTPLSLQEWIVHLTTINKVGDFK